jgi:hypothetical protein
MTTRRGTDYQSPDPNITPASDGGSADIVNADANIGTSASKTSGESLLRCFVSVRDPFEKHVLRVLLNSEWPDSLLQWR